MGHVARMGTGQVDTRLWWGEIMERNHLKDQDIDGMIILKRNFRKRDGVTSAGFIWLTKEIGGGLL